MLRNRQNSYLLLNQAIQRHNVSQGCLVSSDLYVLNKTPDESPSLHQFTDREKFAEIIHIESQYLRTGKFDVPFRQLLLDL